MPVLFADVCLLLDRVAAIKPAQTGVSQTHHPLGIFKAWLSHLHGVTHRQGLLIFRLIFPHHDIRRRYGMQEPSLAAELTKALALLPAHHTRLIQWKSTTHAWRDACCLGASLQHMLSARRCHSLPHSPSISIEYLDNLLDELAAHCPFSSNDILVSHHHPRSRNQILHDIFGPLSAREAAYAAQIILRDLAPLLYPAPSHDLEISLSRYNSNALRELELGNALQAWSWALPIIRRVFADIDTAFLFLEKHNVQAESAYTAIELQELLQKLATPQIGSRIDIPKAVRARSCRDAIKQCIQAIRVPPCAISSKLYLETKYDGERMQIHVDMSNAVRPISIFSKSKRDSTMDRAATHAIILCALRLASAEIRHDPTAVHLAERYQQARISHPQSQAPRKVVLEAEMVAYNEAESAIDEFAYLPECNRSGSFPQASRKNHNEVKRSSPEGLLDSSQLSSSDTRGRLSGKSGAMPKRHLAVVFFDCLLVDDRSLVLESYEERRNILERLVMPIDGYAMLVERKAIDLANLGVRAGQEILAREFARSIVARQEGLMLKMGASTYNDHRRGLQWNKLKKDYIPGLGDSVSCCIVGASWDKVRAQQLRVPTSCYTTFYVGLLENEMERNLDPSITPKYHVLFCVSYMASRAMLLQANQRVLEVEAVPMEVWNTRVQRCWDFELSFAPGMDKVVAVILKKPLVFELFGAGFTRSNGRSTYQLRFPRVSAIHHNRTLEECITLQQMQHMAKKASSCTESEAEAQIDDLWSRCSSSAASDTEGSESRQSPRYKALDWREREQDKWYRKLMKADRVRGHGRDAVDSLVIANASNHQADRSQLSPACVAASSLAKYTAIDAKSQTQSQNTKVLQRPTIGWTVPAANIDYAWFASERTTKTLEMLPRCARLHSLSTLLVQAGYVRRKATSVPALSGNFKNGLIVASPRQSVIVQKHIRKAWRRSPSSQACIAFVDASAISKISIAVLSVKSIPAFCIIDVAI